MTLREAYLAAARRLAAGPHPTETPELDARVLLGFVTGLDHAALLARWPEALQDEAQTAFNLALERRLAGEPVAWITGSKEFMGREFRVGPGLLVPRADTETLVEAALSLNAGPRVLDVCTGTGCIAISLAADFTWAREVWASDLSPLAVETARRNAEILLSGGRRVEVIEADLLEGVPGRWDLIVSNPPYLTPTETHERTVDGGWREPALALDGGGADGLTLIRRLVVQSCRVLHSGGWLLVEAGGPQMPALRSCLEASGFGDLRTWKDLGGVERVIGGRLLSEE